ncbi:zinc ribbon domain-containing protein [Pseudomonadota bacterium]
MWLKVFKAYKFKIHTPSAHKCALLNKTFTQNEYAFFRAVETAREDVLALAGLPKKDRKEGLKTLKKKLAANVKPLPYGNALKASTIEDVAAQVSSYLELKDIGQNAALPQRHDDAIDYDLALQQLLNSLSKEEEDSARDEMARALRVSIRPLSFYKHRISDGFQILKDNKGRFFVFLNLWSAKDKRAKTIEIDMIDVRSGEQLKTSTKTGLLFPLECSNWHAEAMSQGNAKSAKLIRIGEEYYLAVSIEFKVQSRETLNVIGIDRGIDQVASYAVRAPDGSVIEAGNLSGEALRSHQRKMEERQKLSQRKGRQLFAGWSNYSDNLMHHMANEIVALADKYNAQVVIEDLSNIKNNPNFKRPKYQRRNNFSRLLSRQQYGKLEKMLEYKLAMVGLPKPKAVYASYTSVTCPYCGNDDKANRNKEVRANFTCVNCQYHEHADIIGSINIAGKWIWLTANAGKLTKPLPEHLKFNHWQAANLSC